MRVYFAVADLTDDVRVTLTDDPKRQIHVSFDDTLTLLLDVADARELAARLDAAALQAASHTQESES